MQVNEVRESTDKDFEQFYSLVVEEDGWSLKYNKNDITVRTKWTKDSRVKMLKVTAPLEGVSLDCLYDVLHDPDYRKVWDKDMTDSFDVCQINSNTVIGWYGAKMPSPLKYRDWCLYRTWKKQEREFTIMNHSVNHKMVPVTKNYVRSISHVSGYYSERISPTSCKITFLTQTDPKGKLPKWFVNYLATAMSPRIMKKLHKTALKYEKWKKANNPTDKPWLSNESKLPMFDRNDLEEEADRKSDTSDELDEEDVEEEFDIIEAPEDSD